MRWWLVAAALFMALLLVLVPLPAAFAATETPDKSGARATGTPAPKPPRVAAGGVVLAEKAGSPGPWTPGAIYYTVRPGDSMWLIARRFGVTVELVARTNGFSGKKALREGMRLYLPYSNEAGSIAMRSGVPAAKGRGLHFVASIGTQACWLFKDGTLLKRWTCSTGRPGSPSIPGNYTVQTKMPRAYNAAADFWMPAWLGIYDAGVWENGVHGIPYRATNGERLWTDLVGTPITYGCVMLPDNIMQELYQSAYIGMPVTIVP